MSQSKPWFALSFSLAFSGFLWSQESVQSSTTVDRLKQTITHLSEKIGERNLRFPKKLNEAADYLQSTLESMDYKVERQSFEVTNSQEERYNGIPCHNLITEIVGKDKPKEIVLIGAHYDTALTTPGANDNGSGVAALIEIANQLRGKRFSKTIRLVCFTNEEPPFFQNEGQMGSWVYAKLCKQRRDDLKLVLSLETMGYFTDAQNSQNYPPQLASKYPSQGNFIGLVSNMESKKILDEVATSLRKHCEEKVDVQKAALLSVFPGVGWSDHWSFWQEGYMGIMVTDTALFRYPHYHRPTDTVDKIEFVRYSQVVDGLVKTIEEFAN